MSLIPPHGLPAWPTPAILAVHLGVGLALGMIYFNLVWASARQLANQPCVLREARSRGRLRMTRLLDGKDIRHGEEGATAGVSNHAPIAPHALLAILGRLAVLGGVLVLTSLEGAGPLLATALGLLIARPIVMRRRCGTAP